MNVALGRERFAPHFLETTKMQGVSMNVLESWRKTWREGFAPEISTDVLTALADALRNNSTHIVQGRTTEPPPLDCVQDWPVVETCALAFCAAVEHGGFCPPEHATERKVEGYATVGQCEEGFAQLCFKANQRLGEPAACRWFLNWFDDTPRNEMRRELLAEVERELSQRAITK